MSVIREEENLRLKRLPDICIQDVRLPIYTGDDRYIYGDLETLLQYFSLDPEKQQTELFAHPVVREGLATGCLEKDGETLQPILLIRADMLALFITNLNLENMKGEGVYRVIKPIQQEAAIILAEALASGRLTHARRIAPLLEAESPPSIVYKNILMRLHIARHLLFSQKGKKEESSNSVK